MLLQYQHTNHYIVFDLWCNKFGKPAGIQKRPSINNGINYHSITTASRSQPFVVAWSPISRWRYALWGTGAEAFHQMRWGMERHGVQRCVSCFGSCWFKAGGHQWDEWRLKMFMAFAFPPGILMWYFSEVQRNIVRWCGCRWYVLDHK